MAHKRAGLVRQVRVRLRVLSRRLDRNTPEWAKWLTPWGTSMTLHGVLLLALGLFYYASSGDGKKEKVIISEIPLGQLKDDLTTSKASDHSGDPFTTIKTDEPPSIAPIIDPNSDVLAIAEMPPEITFKDKLDLNTPGLDSAPRSAAGEGPSTGAAKGVDLGGFGKAGEMTAPFSGRQGVTKARLVRREGGSVESEKAVERGLDWLARHQRADGAWTLNHRTQCQGAGCPADKSMNSDTAATGLALLPLLGAGQVHVEKGRYQKQVETGIKWLLKTQKPGGDLFAGGDAYMYSHAIATMALCEAYGVTKDSTLKDPAQRAVNFIIGAQNKSDGGWRYTPGEAGDTCVFGWQMFALRSAHLAGLEVPAEAIKGCRRYLDKASADPSGSSYSYQPGTPVNPVMTAEGLLSRQYLGWKREYPAMLEGSQRVAADLIQSQERNIYYWYYGTQLLHNMQGPAWQIWNVKVRDTLVGTQVTGNGCDRGSWHPTLPTVDAWGKEAGRHFMTCLSLLTLEVYYRYLPLYRERDRNALSSDSREEVAADKKPEEKEKK